jgi:hypothetical protein
MRFGIAVNQKFTVSQRRQSFHVHFSGEKTRNLWNEQVRARPGEMLRYRALIVRETTHGRVVAASISHGISLWLEMDEPHYANQKHSLSSGLFRAFARSRPICSINGAEVWSGGDTAARRSAAAARLL